MPHVDITMIPGRDDTAKKETALKDVPKEEWNAHMERLKDKKMFVEPGV